MKASVSIVELTYLFSLITSSMFFITVPICSICEYNHSAFCPSNMSVINKNKVKLHTGPVQLKHNYNKQQTVLPVHFHRTNRLHVSIKSPFKRA